MKRTIKNPHWTNNARTMMSAEFHYDDGRVLTASIACGDVNNNDWMEIVSKFSQEELEANTQKVIRRIQEQQRAEKRQQEAQAEKRRQEELFAIKLQAFEVDIIKNTTEKELRSSIRRAQSVFEVYAYAAAVILKENENKKNNVTE